MIDRILRRMILEMPVQASGEEVEVELVSGKIE
jgi:hypothetical protein